MEVEPEAELFGSLPDALLITLFENLAPSIADLGAVRAACIRFAAIASDDAIWQLVCEGLVGLSSPVGPDGQECPSLFAAAREWCALRCARRPWV